VDGHKDGRIAGAVVEVAVLLIDVEEDRHDAQELQDDTVGEQVIARNQACFAFSDLRDVVDLFAGLRCAPWNLVACVVLCLAPMTGLFLWLALDRR
jgi:hypothetical protein